MCDPDGYEHSGFAKLLLLKSNKSPIDFTWFLCSKKIYDKILNLHVIEVDDKAYFYCVNTGRTYRVANKHCRLLIVNDPENRDTLFKAGFYNMEHITGNDTPRLLKLAAYACQKLNLDGICFKICDAPLGLDNELVFKQGIFIFCDNSITPSTIGNRCQVVIYSKINNDILRYTLEHFPTIPEIDALLKDKKCSEVSRYLFDLIQNN